MNNINKQKLADSSAISYRIGVASEVSGLSVSHINYLIKENKLKSYLPSPKVRLIFREDLINYIKNTEVCQ